MFFSTQTSVPFEDMRQVMQAYPDWKLQFMSGMQVFFIYKVEEGDPDYVDFWHRVVNLPDETNVVEMDDAIERMRENFGVVLTIEGLLKHHMQLNPADQIGLHAFDPRTSKKEFYNIIVTKNSPLGPMLKYGGTKILESGM